MPAQQQRQKGEIPLPPGVPEHRQQVFGRLAEHLENRHCSEVIGHDRTRPGGDPNGRFVVHAMGDEGRSELTRVSSHARAEVAAESHMREGWSIKALYDLDTLAGDEPRPVEGDMVELTDEGRNHVGISGDPRTAGEFYVVGSETDTFDGEAYEQLYLSRNPEADYLADDYDYLVDEAYVVITTPGEADERMPVRYDVAAVIQKVIFNTVPTTKEG